MPNRSRKINADELRQIVEAQSALAAAGFNLDAFMDIMLERTQKMTNAAGAVIELVDGDEMRYAAGSGSMKEFVGFRLKRQGSLSGLCVDTASVMIAEDTSTDPRCNAEACRKVNVASMIVVPLFRMNTAIGVLKVTAPDKNAFDVRQVSMMQMMAGLLGSTLGQQIEVKTREQEEDQLRYQAQYDSLTGLPNRLLFRDRLEHTLLRSAQGGTRMSLFYMDLDKFKSVNDTHGHDAGDTLLKLFSARMKTILRQTDTMCRLGGDEFTVILDGVEDIDDVKRIAALLIEATTQPFDLGTCTVNIGLTIGIALCCDTKSPEQMVKNADAALYEAKKAGRNCYRISGHA